MSMIHLEVTDLIAVVTMDNPPVNAQPMPFMEELIATFDALSDRDDVRSVILTGAGRIFSAGADLKSRPGPDAPPGTGQDRSVPGWRTGSRRCGRLRPSSSRSRPASGCTT